MSSLSHSPLTSGTYTPTFSAGSNVAANTPLVTGYSRVANVVHVFGQINIDPTATGATSFEISLPVPSNLANAYDLVGSMITDEFASGYVRGNTTNDTALFSYVATSAANQGVYFHFSYQVK